MIDMVAWHAPEMDGVISLHEQLLGWLRDCALPLWSTYGVDLEGGGFFETLGFDRNGVLAASGSVRRGRVVARQIFAFDVGHRIGWRPGGVDPVAHGCDYLFAHLPRGDGLFHTAVDAVTHRAVDPFSLYEHAFYLFVLARLAQTGARPDAPALALECLGQLRVQWGKAGGGFNESMPPTLPLKSNPHMHLLEAALEWIEVGGGATQQPWIALARELVGLCLTYFVDASTGAVREYFNHDWRPAPGAAGRVVEPGHQFEWAWLLLRWAESGHVDAAARQAVVNAALRLMEVGEHWGVDRHRGIAINEIRDDMHVNDSAAKIWPQTERLKAWCARLEHARSPGERELACRKIVEAGHGLQRYFRLERPGLWHEVWSADGSFAPGPSKASSFYHIVCAIDVLRRTAGSSAAGGDS